MKQPLDKSLELLPSEILIKSLTEGATSKILKKAAEDLHLEKGQLESLVKRAQQLAEEDGYLREVVKEEEKSRIGFELRVLGLASDNNSRLVKFRIAVRPIIVCSFALALLSIEITSKILLLLGSSVNIGISKPFHNIVLVTTTAWFVSRGIEKLFNRTI